MHLDSSYPPEYLPEPDQHSVLRLGVQPLDTSTWMVRGEDLARFHAHKLAVREQYPDKVCLALPGSEPAQQELQDLLLQHLLTDHGDFYSLTGNRLHHHACGLQWPVEDPGIWSTSCWVQEDLCLMERDGHNGDYRLTAASVCSPSNWKLEEKIGGNLDFIHDPVPGYATALSRRVNRLFDAMKPEKPLLRFNWSLQPDNELFWRKDLGLGLPGSDTTIEKKYWRVERQTLRRLPRSGAIVFTIGISLHRVGAMDQQAGFTAALNGILSRLPEEQKQYKGLI